MGRSQHTAEEWRGRFLGIPNPALHPSLHWKSSTFSAWHAPSFGVSPTEPWDRPRCGCREGSLPAPGPPPTGGPGSCIALSNALSRYGVDAHPHTGFRGHPERLRLQPGPASPGQPGLRRAPLAPPAAAALCAFFRLLHLLLVRGDQGGQVCHKSPGGCKG